MTSFLIKRVLQFLCTLPLLVFVVLALVKLSPEDPVEKLMAMGDYIPEPEVYDKLYAETAMKFDLHLPLFYWHWSPQNEGHIQAQLATFRDQELTHFFLQKGATEKSCVAYIQELGRLNSMSDLPIQSKLDLSQLYTLDKQSNYTIQVSKLKDEYPTLVDSYNNMLASESITNKWPPRLHWNGAANQFHQYIRGIFTLDLGRSFTDNQSVFQKIFNAFQYTFYFVLLGSLISVPLALWWGKISTIYEQKWWVKSIEVIMYLFYAIPLFWLATMLLILFTTNEYGTWTDWFQVPQAYDFSQSRSPIQNFIQYSNRFVLPILCLLLHDLAIFGRQVKTLIKGETSKNYMLTALMKGLNRNQVVQEHAYKNAKVQIVTLITGGIAGFFRGSLVIEFIFNIPGIGRLTYDSVRSVDIPVLMGVVLLIFTLTSVIYAVADILYTRFNPKLALS